VDFVHASERCHDTHYRSNFSFFSFKPPTPSKAIGFIVLGSLWRYPKATRDDLFAGGAYNFGIDTCQAFCVRLSTQKHNLYKYTRRMR
jgi:hypothetical protein